MPFSHNACYHRLLLRQIPAGASEALDVGCGTFGRRAARAGMNVHAVDSWLEVLGEIITDPNGYHPSVVSCSYGNPADGVGTFWTQATNLKVDAMFASAASRGITVCCASGDDGSRDQVPDGLAHADYPASSPHVLGVGGTHLEASGGAITAETVWDNATGGATGGGVSELFPLPIWQNEAGVPRSTNPPHHVGRGVPDVSADADPETGVIIIRLNGKRLTIIGGTSAAAPQWAALIARINQELGAPVGFLNPLLYQLGKGLLRDITQGGNGAYKAGIGWDANTAGAVPAGRPSSTRSNDDPSGGRDVMLATPVCPPLSHTSCDEPTGTRVPLRGLGGLQLQEARSRTDPHVAS